MRKALNERDVLGSDVVAICIGFAKVPVKDGQEGTGQDEAVAPNVTGVCDLSVGATIHALRNVKAAATVPENHRSNLLLSMIASGLQSAQFDLANKVAGWTTSVTEQQLIMKELSGASADAEVDFQALSGMFNAYSW